MTFIKGHKPSAETLEKQRLAKLGKKHSEEWKRHQSESLKGKPNGRLGKHHSLETREKMSKSASGKIRSEEHRKN